MSRIARVAQGLCWALVGLALVSPLAHGQTIIDKLKIGKHKHADQTPFVPHFKHQFPPMTTVELANVIDIVEEGLRDDGIVAIQTPSVWGQARMTVYRREFDEQMRKDLENFSIVLSARIARSDSASFQSITALGASLSRSRGNSSNANATVQPPAADLKAMVDLFEKLGNVPKTDAFALFDKAFKSVSNDAKLGLDPTIYLDEKKRYLDHLNQIRRINMGDDNADSAGYGMYLIRMPVSITTGEKTREGFGAQLSATLHHEFTPDFMPRTFRTLVINDLIDVLTPLVYEIIEHDAISEYDSFIEKVERELYLRQLSEVTRLVTSKAAESAASLKQTNIKSIRSPKAYLKQTDDLKSPNAIFARHIDAATKFVKGLPSTTTGTAVYPIPPSHRMDVFRWENVIRLSRAVKESLHTVHPRALDIRNLLRRELEAAYDFMERGTAEQPPVLANCAFLDQIYDAFKSRNFEDDPLGSDLESRDAELLAKLPTALSGKRLELEKRATINNKSYVIIPARVEYDRTIASALCWAIAVEAALLNQRLRDDIADMRDTMGFKCTQPLESLYFYLSYRTRGYPAFNHAETVFQEYVKARWPLVVFSLDPTIEQQNIADAYAMRRELQLALAYAFSTGRINFSQLNRFQRRLEYDAETIALNRVITAFSHGNDTFGWRFTPRYQNPPREATNAHTLGNLLLRGGPSNNFPIKHSKLENGQRELHAVVLMPSFLHQIRMDVESSWFRLTNPDDFRVTTARRVEQGRYVRMLQEAAKACDAQDYRAADVRVLFSKLKQLEAMLPMQTHVVPVPFENTLGGFELFGQGNTALAPKLVGYEAADAAVAPSALQGGDYPTKVNANAVSPGTDVLLYGKYISILETNVVAGGKSVADMDILSREVMRIRIPQDAQPTLIADERGAMKFIEVHLATPNGISNRILIPYRLPVEAKPEEPVRIFKLKAEPFTLRLSWFKESELRISSPPPKKDSVLTWNVPGTPPKEIVVQYKITTGRGVDPQHLPIKLQSNDGSFAIRSEILPKKIAETLVKQGQYKAADALPESVKVEFEVVQVDTTPVFPQYSKVGGMLEVKLEQAIAPDFPPPPNESDRSFVPRLEDVPSAHLSLPTLPLPGQNNEQTLDAIKAKKAAWHLPLLHYRTRSE